MVAAASTTDSQPPSVRRCSQVMRAASVVASDARRGRSGSQPGGCVPGRPSGSLVGVMRTTRGVAPLVLALVLPALACSKRTDPAPLPHPAPSAPTAAAASTAPSASASGANGPVAPASEAGSGGPQTDVERILAHFFAGYVDGADFAFLDGVCAPRLDEFLRMKAVTPA